ncbi:MAG: acetate--CoA ligase family protein [Myxococcales bacterium]|nr:acetate--CoA ligase family protein [Myxococcales bacterium]
MTASPVDADPSARPDGEPTRSELAARSLAALLAPRPGAAVLVAEPSAAHVDLPGERLAEPALARRLRDEPAAVVVAHSLSPTLQRALRERPPALLVLTGPADADALPHLPHTLVLGPEARIHVEGAPAGGPRAPSPVPADSRQISSSPVPADSRHAAVERALVACATSARELAALLAALAAAGHPRTVRLAAAPTPRWWPALLADPQLADCTAVGFVAAAALDPSWARVAADRHVLVPEGLAPARVDQPRDPGLGPAVAAHALERWTGPVFPDPAVLALLAAPPPTTPATAADQALWTQACRALPTLGAPAVPPGLPPAAPTAAFLAQRALLRRDRTRALAREPAPAPPRFDEAALARAEEVLRSAGQVLSEHESKVVLRGFGVEITRQAVASSASGAAQFAEQIGWPVVLKALSPDLRRKQDVGAVVLGLTTAAAVRRAYAAILASVEQHAPTARLDGVLVAEQAPDGLEIECGAVRLADGQVALHGRPLGLPQPAEPILALSPLSAGDAVLLADAILARVPALRRASDPGVAELAALFLRLDALVRHFDGRILTLELGPIRLIQPPRGYLTLDARITQRPHLEGV